MIFLVSQVELSQEFERFNMLQAYKPRTTLDPTDAISRPALRPDHSEREALGKIHFSPKHEYKTICPKDFKKSYKNLTLLEAF